MHEVIQMMTYRGLYNYLFAQLSRATEALEEGNHIRALDILITAQQQAEELAVTQDVLPDDEAHIS